MRAAPKFNGFVKVGDSKDKPKRKRDLAPSRWIIYYFLLFCWGFTEYGFLVFPLFFFFFLSRMILQEMKYLQNGSGLGQMCWRTMLHGAKSGVWVEWWEKTVMRRMPGACRAWSSKSMPPFLPRYSCNAFQTMVTDKVGHFMCKNFVDGQTNLPWPSFGLG